MTSDCLVEIGTEELPPAALQTLADGFASLVREALAEAGLAAGDIDVFATPRRIALLLRSVPPRQADRVVEKRGPALTAAFDEAGKATRAATGFAASCGVDVDALERRETDKGSWLYFVTTEAGSALADLLPEIVYGALERLPIPRRMRWGARSDEFVRPVKWFVLMIDDAVIDAECFGLKSGRRTRGHRFHAPGEIEIPTATDYESLLRSQGLVIARFDERRATIRKQVEQAATRLGGRAEMDPALLDEVTALVEYPVAVCGQFDAGFLDLPPEVLVTTMQDNQKYFALFDADGALLPHFIAIANLDSKRPEVVAAGNERVIRPRFADAGFFFAQDRKLGLDAMRIRLDDVVFQEKLGSLGERSGRITRLAKYIASQTGAEQDLVRRAAELCKADLMSDMVGEFPKLQGVIGRYYAALEQEDPVVCGAIEQHYWPRFAGDRLPADDVAGAIALADRLDLLIGIFGIGARPGGDKDPFGLRRAALGVVRILIEGKLALDLYDLGRAALDGYFKKIEAEGVIEAVVEYVVDRLRAYYQEQGIGYDRVDAVTWARPGNLFDCDRRIRAVDEFQSHDAAPALAAANKRIANILKQQDPAGLELDPALFDAEAEIGLHDQLVALGADVGGHFARAEYLAGLERLAELRPAVDRFFDEVMVMVDDPALRNNRLALLAQLMQSFRQVADFSRIRT